MKVLKIYVKRFSSSVAEEDIEGEIIHPDYFLLEDDSQRGINAALIAKIEKDLENLSSTSFCSPSSNIVGLELVKLPGGIETFKAPPKEVLEQSYGWNYVSQDEFIENVIEWLLSLNKIRYDDEEEEENREIEKALIAAEEGKDYQPIEKGEGKPKLVAEPKAALIHLLAELDPNELPIGYYQYHHFFYVWEIQEWGTIKKIEGVKEKALEQIIKQLNSLQ